jgi:hypothetical protein
MLEMEAQKEWIPSTHLTTTHKHLKSIKFGFPSSGNSFHHEELLPNISSRQSISLLAIASQLFSLAALEAKIFLIVLHRLTEFVPSYSTTQTMLTVKDFPSENQIR